MDPFTSGIAGGIIGNGIWDGIKYAIKQISEWHKIDDVHKSIWKPFIKKEALIVTPSQNYFGNSYNLVTSEDLNTILNLQKILLRINGKVRVYTDKELPIESMGMNLIVIGSPIMNSISHLVLSKIDVPYLWTTEGIVSIDEKSKYIPMVDAGGNLRVD